VGFKRTGLGRGERRLHPPGTLLFNFDIEGAALKQVHHDFLRMYVEPVLRRQGSVTIVGLASRTGRRRFNQHLSEERARRTLAYLRQQVRNDFNVIKAVGYGERKAEREGYADETEDPRFRSVILFTSDNPNPPPAPARIDLTPLHDRGVEPGTDWGDEIQKVLDRASGISSLMELVPAFAEVAGTAGLVLNIVSAVVQMPLLWWSVRHHNVANGTLQGFWEAIQDMANTYSDPALAGVDMSQWPPLRMPQAHPLSGGVNEQEWMEGRRQGCKAAYDLIQKTENKTNGGIEGGRRFLFDLYQQYGTGAGDAIKQFYRLKLLEKGKDWPLRD
jgi:hypothetical protein